MTVWRGGQWEIKGTEREESGNVRIRNGRIKEAEKGDNNGVRNEGE